MPQYLTEILVAFQDMSCNINENTRPSVWINYLRTIIRLIKLADLLGPVVPSGGCGAADMVSSHRAGFPRWIRQYSQCAVGVGSGWE